MDGLFAGGMEAICISAACAEAAAEVEPLEGGMADPVAVDVGSYGCQRSGNTAHLDDEKQYVRALTPTFLEKNLVSVSWPFLAKLASDFLGNLDWRGSPISDCF